MAKPKGGLNDQPQTPKSFPDTTPPLAMDPSHFTLQTILTMQATLGGLSKQMEGMESNISDIARDARNHGKWIYAANVVAAILFAVVGFVCSKLWDIAESKILQPTAVQTAPATGSPTITK